MVVSMFFLKDTATPEIYTPSLHDALPIYPNIPRNSQVDRGIGQMIRCRAQFQWLQDNTFGIAWTIGRLR